MRPQTLIQRISECGYTFELKNSDIILRYTRQEEPPKEKVLFLVNELKAHKLEVVQYLKTEHFLSSFQDTVNKMADKYKDSLFDYTRSRNPEKYEQFNQVENRINKFWDEGNFENFQKELETWKNIYTDLLELFSEAEKHNNTKWRF